MKKLLYVLSALVLAGCTISEIGGDTVGEISRNVVYTASFEGVDTKVYVDTDLKTHWTADDRISIFASTYNEEYKFDGQTGDIEGSFSVVDDKVHTGESIPVIYAVYPYDEGTAITSDGVITLNLPGVQNYAENSYGPGANTMVAVTESKSSKELNFKSVCGYVVVRLYGEGTVKAITLSGNNEEKLAGPATVAHVYGQAPAVVMSDIATTSITLDCGEGVKLGKTVNEATAFWFAVPPITFSKGFTIRVTNTDLCSMERSTSAERTVTRNIKNPLSPLETNFDIPDEGFIQFEDANFKAYCVQNFDKNGDGEISYEEGLSITRIVVNTDNITSLVGIEHFVNLKHLSCKGSWSNTAKTSLGKLNSLDVSNNMSLEYLNCGYNHLTSLDVSNHMVLKNLYCYYNQLISLDVSNNTALEYMACQNNQLTSLNLNKNTALGALNCNSNQLTTLDVSKNTAFIILKCGSNQLKSLDVSYNTALGCLDCNSNKLTSLDVNNNTALTALECYNNLLTTLDVSNNTALTGLHCNSNRLMSLDISNNAALTSLECYDNQLAILDVSNNTVLRYLYCYNNPSLTEIWLRYGQTIDKLEYDTDIATIKYKGAYINFEDDNFKAYCVQYFDTNGDREISYEEAEMVSVISCNDKGITSLKGIQYFTALTNLYCSENQLTTLDVRNNTALTVLSCHSNQLTTLDVSNNTALKDLYCYNNQLTTLNVSKNTALTILSCKSNQLTTLDVSKNTALLSLSCYSNQLTTLDVSKNTALTVLSCYSNQLATLDVSNNTTLERLYCSSNQLMTLDVSKNTALIQLNCSSNQLTTLDASKNTALIQLNCSSNQLINLDVSNNSVLEFLDCRSNPSLTEIWLKTGQTIANFMYDANVATIYYK